MRSGKVLVPLLMWCALITGCGVQADEDAAACAGAEAFFLVKDDADALDRELLDLRPDEMTVESIKALAPRYEDAADEYDALLGRAEGELERARMNDSDLVPVWELTTESLTIRRDGFRFTASAFANPRAFDQAALDEIESWGRKTNDVNIRLEERSSQWFRDHGFEETEGGNFIVDC